MQQKAQKKKDYEDYKIEREFLGDITATELIEQIIHSHLFPPAGQETKLPQEEGKVWSSL